MTRPLSPSRKFHDLLDQATDSNIVIERMLDERITTLEELTDSDVISLHGPIVWGVDDLLRLTIEREIDAKLTRRRVSVVLTTGGGYIEVVRRMVDTIRHFYEVVEFIVPNYAYSAGTIFVMSGDAIHMDYYSRLGPIDPQVPTLDGITMVPALGYVERYNDLIEKAESGQLNEAELQVLIGSFDQAQLFKYEHELELSVALLEEWLCKYKFKDWHVTETQGIPIDEAMRRKRAKEIAVELNDTTRWHSHGHGISLEVLESELKLKIDDFGRRPELANAIRKYQGLLTDFMPKNGLSGVVHVRGAFGPFA